MIYTMHVRGPLAVVDITHTLDGCIQVIALVPLKKYWIIQVKSALINEISQ